MGITLSCFNPQTGQMESFQANSVGQGGSGIGQSTIGPATFGAKKLNLCMYDVQQTIQEGRAAGLKPFNIYNSASPWESAQ